jgi:C1A family cysteine protease
MEPKLVGVVPDSNDKQYKVFSKSLFEPREFNLWSNKDLSGFSSPRHKQLNVGCCVAASTVKALEIKRIIKYGISRHVDLSILHLYWMAREQMGVGRTSFDTGTQISIACDVLRKFGVCREVLFPFNTSKVYTPPPVMALREAKINTIKSHYKIFSHGEERLKEILFNLHHNNPVVFATAVGKTWFKYNNASGPLGKEEEPKGLHAMVIVGYKDGLFIVENSWGAEWGKNGFCFVKPEVLTSSASFDFWAIVDGSEAWKEIV